jgi:asparagine synthase (glutamine-hydrolysing)
MCGIAGSINHHYNAQKAENAMRHRGPDALHTNSFDNVMLTHNRLSIVDIEHGHQPFKFEQYVLIFNGEIYNHMELRRQLSDVNFTSQSDTETLLHLLLKFGVKGLQQTDGMFAYALLDTQKNILSLGRDRAGKKPLYYYKDAHSFVFASELNTLRAMQNLAIDETQIANYLRVGYFFAPNSAYQNVHTIASGSVMTLDTQNLEHVVEHYYDPMDAYQKKNPDLSLEDALRNCDILLNKSVKNRMLSSDLEVGAFLSGGIDSGLIVAHASKYSDNLKTFTVSFDGAYDESNLAKLVADKYQTEHHVINLDMNVKNDIETILNNYGQPFFDSSAIPSYYVSKAAKEHVTVVLNGDGADELFGGYRRYVPMANGWIKIVRKMQWILPFLPKAHQKKSLYNFAYRLLEMGSKTAPIDFYLSATIDLMEDFESEIKGTNLEAMAQHIKAIFYSNLSSLDTLLLADFTDLLLSNLLVKMDIATMAHSLEGRSPFLSSYLLDFAPTLPDQFKVNKRTTKYLLRTLAQNYLPDQLINQPKRGFEIPLKAWVNSDLKEIISSYLENGSYSSNYINQSFITSLLNNKIEVSQEKRSKILWNMLSLEIWHKGFKQCG